MVEQKAIKWNDVNKLAGDIKQQHLASDDEKLLHTYKTYMRCRKRYQVKLDNGEGDEGLLVYGIANCDTVLQYIEDELESRGLSIEQEQSHETC